jgi:hypothetical protein
LDRLHPGRAFVQDFRAFPACFPATRISSAQGRARALPRQPPNRRLGADIVRIDDGKRAEHWDVPQDKATKAQSVNGLPMFGERFPD